MPNNKRHTLKKIKNREAVHPYSRKARQIARVVQRQEKLSNKKLSRQSANNSKAERWLWFRFALDETAEHATEDEIHELIAQYLKRNDEELEKLVKERQRSSHRTKKPREDVLVALKESEANEYASGLELPDMTDAETVKVLREWDGDVNGMPQIKKKVFKKPKPEQDHQMDSTTKAPAVETSSAMDMS